MVGNGCRQIVTALLEEKLKNSEAKLFLKKKHIYRYINYSASVLLIATCLFCLHLQVPSKGEWLAGWGRGLHLPLCPCKAPSASRPGASCTGRMQSCWNRSRGPQRWSEVCSTSPLKKGWVSWARLAWRRLLGDLVVASQYLKKAYKLEGDWLFTGADSKYNKGEQLQTKRGEI